MKDKPIANGSRDGARARWRNFLAERGFSHSRLREAVVAVMLDSDGHLTLHEIWQRVRRGAPNIALATVYRTLHLLEEGGFVWSADFGHRGARYERAYGRRHHDHIICTNCGKIEEFESEEIESLQDAVAAEHGFKVLRHRHELYGICADCKVAAS
jgi:Fur family transcriptional regulator, ferric uptake regulator